MCRHTNLYFILIVASVLLATGYGEIITRITSFEDNFDILDKLNDTRQRLRLSSAIWGEIRVDFSDDLTKAQALYQHVPQIISDPGSTLQQAQAGEEFEQELRRHLIAKNAQLLTDSLHGKVFIVDADIHDFCADLLRDYQPEVVLDILTRTIDELYNLKSVTYIVKPLFSIYSQGVDDLQHYELMLQSQLYLYRKFVALDDVNDSYLFHLGYYLREVRNDQLHAKLSDSLKRRLDKTIDSLPSTLQHLYFRPSFCLRNKQTSDLFYTSHKYEADAERRYVLTATNDLLMSQAPWALNITAKPLPWDATTELDLLFSFIGVELQTYMYVERQLANLTMAWQSGTAPVDSAWSLQLQEDQLIFMQSDNIMCESSTPFKDTTNRRYVYAYSNKERSAADITCQWQAIECPAKH